MARRFGMEIEGRWHLFARSVVEIYSYAGGRPKAKAVPLQIFVADRSIEEPGLRFAVVQSPRKVRTFAEGLRGDQKFLKKIHAILKQAGARNVDALGFSDDSDLGTETSMILEGAVTLPPGWEERVAPQPKAGPALVDPDRVRIGQRVNFSDLLRLFAASGSRYSDRCVKVAEFSAGIAGYRKVQLNAFVYLDSLRTPSWKTLLLVFRTKEDQETLKHLTDHSRELVARSAAALHDLGVDGTSDLRFHRSPAMLNAVTLTWTGSDFAFSALERFAKALGVNIPKLCKYREDIGHLLKTAEAVCGKRVTEGPHAYLVQGSADHAKVVPRLIELGWTRNADRSGQSLDRGFHYFHQGDRKLTVNLGANPILFESGWREPFAPWRGMPYVKS